MSIEFCQALFRVWASMLSSMSSISWQWLITMLNYPYIWGLKNPLGLIVSSRYFLIQFVSNLLWVLNKVNKEFWSLVFSCYNTFILSRCKDELSSSFIFKKKSCVEIVLFLPQEPENFHHRSHLGLKISFWKDSKFWIQMSISSWVSVGNLHI